MFGKTIPPFLSESVTWIAVAGLAAVMGLVAVPAAKADSVQFGVTVGNGYGGGYGGGWHHPHPHYWGGYNNFDDDDDYDAPPPPPPPPRYGYRLSCADAADVVRDAGFRGVRASDCSGRVYQFDAWKNGRPVNVDVTSSGRIVGVDPN